MENRRCLIFILVDYVPAWMKYIYIFNAFDLKKRLDIWNMYLFISQKSLNYPHTMVPHCLYSVYVYHVEKAILEIKKKSPMLPTIIIRYIFSIRSIENINQIGNIYNQIGISGITSLSGYVHYKPFKTVWVTR